MRKLILVLLLISMVSFCKEQKASNRFPHKLWLYWHSSNISSASIFVQLCINNIHHYATASGWEVQIVSNDNIHQHLNQQSNKQLNYLKQRIVFLTNKELTHQALSDLFRTFLLHDNGGMWVDISCVFLRDFSWVQNLEELGLVQNSMAKQPEIIMFTSDAIFGGNKTVIFDKKQKEIYLFPGLQFWSVIAKPHINFFQDMIKELVYTFSQQNLDDYIQEKKKQGYLYLQQIDKYFLYSTIHFQTLLQRKQREIDSNPDSFNVKYAVQYYGIWSINSIDTAYSLSYYYGWQDIQLVQHVFHQTYQLLPQLARKTPFLKFNGFLRVYMDNYISSALNRECMIKEQIFIEKSLFNQYLLKYSENLPFVKELRSRQENGQKWGQAQCSPQIGNFANILVIKALLTAAAIILLILICVWYLRKTATFIDDKITKMYTEKINE